MNSKMHLQVQQAPVLKQGLEVMLIYEKGQH